MWALRYTNQARKDATKLASSGLKDKTQALLEIISRNPTKTQRHTKNWLAI